MLTRLLRRLDHDDQGVTLIEFALCSSILLMTILGTLEFGLAVWRYNMVSNLAQEGARFAVVRGANAAVANRASAADVQTFVQNRANNIIVTVATTSATGGMTGTCSTTSINPSTISSGSAVCVKVTTTYTPLSGFVPQGMLTLTGTAKMIMQR